jgi:hypothetical protein
MQIKGSVVGTNSYSTPDSGVFTCCPRQANRSQGAGSILVRPWGIESSHAVGGVKP